MPQSLFARRDFKVGYGLRMESNGDAGVWWGGQYTFGIRTPRFRNPEVDMIFEGNELAAGF